MRSVVDLLGGPPPGDLEGPTGVAAAALSPIVQAGQVNSAPLGSETGAPPWARFQQVQVVPGTAVGQNLLPTRVAAAERANRVITLTAPLIAFTVWIGDSGVRPGFGLALPAGLPYDLIIPGGQEVFAVTDAPVYVTVQIQAAPLLVGDKERRA